jgi:hypothetical protein
MRQKEGGKVRTEYCIKDENDNAYFIGDHVDIKIFGADVTYTGTITHITCKGLYLDVGGEKDTYCRDIIIESIDRV